jgi:Predicted GTPase
MRSLIGHFVVLQKRCGRNQIKKRASVEFVEAAYLSVHDKLVAVIQSFPTISDEPQFYQDIVEILWTTDRLKSPWVLSAGLPAGQKITGEVLQKMSDTPLKRMRLQHERKQ